MTDRYCGRLIADMSVDELRAALAECVEWTQAEAQIHQEHIAMLRNMIALDQRRHDLLFMDYARPQKAGV